MKGKPSHTAPRDGIRNLILNNDQPAREALVEALITALAAENLSSRNPASFSRDEEELRIDLVWALAELRVPRSSDVLLDAVNTGNEAVAALSSFGDKSLPRVMQRLGAKPDRETKLSLMLVILQMCDSRNLPHISAESKTTIRQTLLSALNDRDPLIRQTGCKGLALLADLTAIPDLERVAAGDPETSIKSKRVTYPIRDEAKEAIETIKENQPAPKPEDKVKTAK
jgi:HEAT repeat protein